MAGKLILVRHGETPSNVAKVLDTVLPGAPLTERGVAQAKEFGSRLAAPPQLLVSSKALRAEQTARHIAESIDLTPVSLEGLHEVQLGELDGTSDEASYQQFSDIFHAWHAGDLAARPPGGESGADVLDRIVPVLAELRARYLTSDGAADNGAKGGVATGDVLVVSHGAAIRLVARYLAAVPPLFAANNHLRNTATVELVPLVDGGWQCVRWGPFEPPFVEVSPTADLPMG